MGQEITLMEMEEIVGEYHGTTTNNLFTEITVGGNSLMMESAAANTKAITAQLKHVKRGCKIGILKFNGAFKLRRCKSER